MQGDATPIATITITAIHAIDAVEVVTLAARGTRLMSFSTDLHLHLGFLLPHDLDWPARGKQRGNKRKTALHKENALAKATNLTAY